VRLGWNALQLTTPAGKAFDLIGYLQCLPPDLNPHEVNMRASTGRNEPALALSVAPAFSPDRAVEYSPV